MLEGAIVFENDEASWGPEGQLIDEALGGKLARGVVSQRSSGSFEGRDPLSARDDLFKEDAGLGPGDVIEVLVDKGDPFEGSGGSFACDGVGGGEGDVGIWGDILGDRIGVRGIGGGRLGEQGAGEEEKGDSYVVHRFSPWRKRDFAICCCFLLLNARRTGGLSSVGRASDLHSEGQEFESPSLHFLKASKRL